MRLRKETSKTPVEQAGREPPPEFANLTVELLQPVQHSKRYAITNVDSLGVIERFTYAEITRETARWAQLLREKGLQPGDRVLIVAGREWGWRCALLGAIHAGGVAVPCPPSLPLREVRTVREHADASLLVALRPPPELVELDGRSALTADDLETVDPSHALAQRPHRTDPRDIALILYAWHGLDLIGTMHTHASLLAQADTADHWLGVDGDERIWATAEDGSGPSIWLLLAAWRQAASIVVVDLELDSDAKLELLDRLRPAALWFSDDEYAVLGSAAAPPWVDLRSIRRALVDSEGTDGASSFANSFGPALVPILALDELGVLAGWPTGLEARADAETAQPVPGVRVAVLGEDGTELPPGEVGDVAVRGDARTLFTGYAGKEGRSRSAGWFRFGWRGALTADGALRVETRSPREVEPVDASADLPVPATVEEPQPAEPVAEQPAPSAEEDAAREEADREAAEVEAQRAAQAEARAAEDRQREVAAARAAADALLLAEQEAKERAAAAAEEHRRAEQEAKEREKSEAEERRRAEEQAKAQQAAAAADAKQRAEEEKRREKEREREEKEARAHAEREAKEREQAEAEDRRRAEEDAKSQAKVAAAEATQRDKDEKERQKREAEAAKVQAKAEAAEAKQREKEAEEREKREAKEREEREKREAEAAKVQAKVDAAEAKQRAKDDKEREKREARERAEREKAEAEAAKVQAKVDAAEAKQRAKDDKEREKREAVERVEREKREAEAAKVQAKVDAAEAKQRAKDDKEREKREARERAEREKAEAEAAKVQAKVEAAEAKQRAEDDKRREKEREREEKGARKQAEQEAKEAERAERRAAREEKRRAPEAPEPADDGPRRFGRRRREVVEEPEPEHVPDVVARIQQYGMSASSSERPAEPPAETDDE